MKPKEILSNEFSTFFLNKVENIVTKTSTIAQNERINTIVDYTSLKEKIDPLSEFKEHKVSKIKDIFMSSTSKVSPLDPVPTKFLKKLIDVLINFITVIVSKSLFSGKFPQI